MVQQMQDSAQLNEWHDYIYNIEYVYHLYYNSQYLDLHRSKWETPCLLIWESGR